MAVGHFVVFVVVVAIVPLTCEQKYSPQEVNDPFVVTSYPNVLAIENGALSVVLEILRFALNKQITS